MTTPDQDPALEAEVERQMAELRRGATQIVSEEGLRARIARSVRTGRPLRVKLGVDPTAHDLHLGFTLPLRKLQVFSELGHQPVLIIGDATAMVGDPSGRNKARPQLTREMVDDYAASYLRQASKVLDLERVEVRRNSEWLGELGFSGMIGLVGHATVAQLLVREDFAKRYREGTPIYLHEFVYPLLQGWDSVVVRADVELGGQDQLFNLLIGRDLQEAEGQEAQICMMGPLLVGLDGSRKMSKSFGNSIGLDEAPGEMFGKVMSLPDELMRPWFELATTLPLDEIEAIFAAGSHPRDLKDRLGREIVERFHDEAAAQGASDEFRRIFTEQQLPSEIEELPVPADALDAEGRIWIVALLRLAGFVTSNGEGMRLVSQGGIKIEGEAVGDPKAEVTFEDGAVLRAGKKRFVRLRRPE
ncbi:MAG: tyrosine--tRNA ligase [Planctomycetota bacterium]